MNLHDPMPNGAQIVDWLGTARNAVRVAANLIEDARDYTEQAPERKIRDALEQAEQAVYELRAVLRHVGEPVESLTIERAFLARLMAAIETPGDLSDPDVSSLLTDAELIYHGGPA